jgi:hypothetical protein
MTSCSLVVSHPATAVDGPRVRLRAARPDLPPDAPAARAALVLAAGPEHGFNVDRIARACRLPRPWVAGCVRRLVDNGVWSGGRAECAWSDADDPRFWNDAAVAEGRLQRRTLPDGRVEWAPPGRWTKSYDFVGPQSEPGGPVLYLDPAPDGGEAPFAALRDAGPPAAERESPLASERRFPRIHDRTAARQELFPGAAWLR